MVAAAGIYALQIRSCHCCGPVQYKSIATYSVQCCAVCMMVGWLCIHTCSLCLPDWRMSCDVRPSVSQLSRLPYLVVPSNAAAAAAVPPHEGGSSTCTCLCLCGLWTGQATLCIPGCAKHPGMDCVVLCCVVSSFGMRMLCSIHAAALRRI